MFTSIKLILFLSHLASSSILKVDAFITPPRNVVVVRNYHSLHTFTNDRMKNIDIPSSIEDDGGIGGNNDDDNNYGDRGGHNNNNGGSGAGSGGGDGGGGSGDDGDTGGFYNDPRFVFSTLSIAFAERYKRDVQLQEKAISSLLVSSTRNNGLSRFTTSTLSLSTSTAAAAEYGMLPTTTTSSIQKQIMKRVISFVQSYAQPQLVTVKVKATECIKWYMMEIEKNPLIVKSVSSGVISLCADFAAQSFEQRQASHHEQQQQQQQTALKRYDKRRLWACFTEGMFIAGPLMHFGYSWFESMLPVQNGLSSSQGSNIAAATQVIADSIILDSIFVATKILSTGILEGLSFHNDIIPQFQNEYWDTMKASWVTSIGLFPVEFACFRYLPLSLRTFSMSITSIIWDSVVSHKAHESRL